MKFVMVLLISSFVLNPLFAQFSVTGEIRPRGELRQGYQRMPEPEDIPAGLISQRTRLTFAFLNKQVTTRVSIQDVRIWGQEETLTHEPSLDLHEAWFQLHLNERLSVRAGRQVIQYDNQRFLAVNDWSQVAQKHDGLVLCYYNNGNELHLGSAINQNEQRLSGTDYYLSNYKTLNFIWYKTSIAPSFDLSVLAMADGFEHPENPRLLYMRATWSAFFSYKSGLLSVHANPAIQHGKTPYGQDIASWYFSSEAALSTRSYMRNTVGFEVLSGNDHMATESRYRAFDPTYGAEHTVHGFMDYFTNIPVHTSEAGLINPYLKNRIFLNDRLIVDADLHLFYIQNNYIHQEVVIDKFLGTEVDLTLRYSFNPITRISFGYSVMFGSESMEVIKGGDKDQFAHWAFVMLRVKPSFL
jgi:hypothetical protein